MGKKLPPTEETGAMNTRARLGSSRCAVSQKAVVGAEKKMAATVKKLNKKVKVLPKEEEVEEVSVESKEEGKLDEVPESSLSGFAASEPPVQHVAELQVSASGASAKEDAILEAETSLCTAKGKLRPPSESCGESSKGNEEKEKLPGKSQREESKRSQAPVNVWERRRLFANMSGVNRSFDGLVFKRRNVVRIKWEGEQDKFPGWRYVARNLRMERFWALYDQKKSTKEWENFKAIPISRPETKNVTIIFKHESVPPEDILVWRMESPNSFFIGRERGVCFYPGQPRQCFKCGSNRHLAINCETKDCPNAWHNIVRDCPNLEREFQEEEEGRGHEEGMELETRVEGVVEPAVPPETRRKERKEKVTEKGVGLW
ncbi:hypothetical protein XELAEV_18026560mg [Xenopus laevis]|uniref:CCHC-type domain-containing protein n=1 Tax=Xenopus laevis TaxID=8355 RepID=A0A974CWB4_XENLA|nr:hypothetical protein XELAEV_18026560mg [Xenopus laevis]